VRIGKEAVLGANVVLTASSKIIDVTGPEPIESKTPYISILPPKLCSMHLKQSKIEKSLFLFKILYIFRESGNTGYQRANYHIYGVP
jgi:tetrahydrodipicolinate N-succinyltransferase